MHDGLLNNPLPYDWLIEETYEGIINAVVFLKKSYSEQDGRVSSLSFSRFVLLTCMFDFKSITTFLFCEIP